MLRTACFLLIVTGGIIMAISTWRYHQYLKQNRRESYGPQRSGRFVEVLSELVMVFFVFGFVVGAADVFVRDVEPIYLFVGVVFFVGSVFVATMVQVQISMALSLREKSLEVMRGFASSIEMKDTYTRGHSRHVFLITKVFAEHLPANYRKNLNTSKLLDAALLHDIGKMGVPDGVLAKPGPLTEEEWAQVRLHPDNGKKMLAGTCFEEIGDWVLYHHERVDGEGYHKLPGIKSPLESRIIAIADTYSAITTNREYRPCRTHEQALQEMRRVAGTQLDPGLVECFCHIDEDELAELVDHLETSLA